MAGAVDALKFLTRNFASGVEAVKETLQPKKTGVLTGERIVKQAQKKKVFKAPVTKEQLTGAREAGIFEPAGVGKPVTFSFKDAIAVQKQLLPKMALGESLTSKEEDLLAEANRVGFETAAAAGIGFIGGMKLGPGFDIPAAGIKSNALTKHIGFLDDILAPQKFRPPIKGAKVGALGKVSQQAQQAGIALRATKGGKIVPAVRQAGPFVPNEFTSYQNFKNVNPGALGGTKDITRLIQEMDGALPVEQLAKLPDQAGPLSKFVLFRTRDVMRQSIEFSNELIGRLKPMVGNIARKSKESFTANKVLEKISSEDKLLSVEELIKKPAISSLTKNSDVVRFARDARVFFDDLLDAQNIVRNMRNQKLIPKRKLYSPNEFRDRTLWERAFGLKKQPQDLIHSPELPDYIFPNKPFNPRELARQAGIPEMAREMDLVTLLDNYSRTATKDIFATSIVQNNKAFIQELETMGFPESARALQNWTAESFGGVKAQLDRAVNLSPVIEKGMRWFRSKLVRSVFPLNFGWNTFVQTSSINLTGTRYGWLNTGKSAIEWATNPKIRKDIMDNAYSAIVKSQKTGKISQQSINQGVNSAKKIQQTKMETAVDAANFFTEWVERHLTGISVRAGFNDGIKRGLKGKALWEYASDAGAKTQSMYNMEDLPGVLRSNTAKTVAPFQTFTFEMYNTMRELAGKTGTPPGTFQERMKWVLRFMAGMWAINEVSSSVSGREPWKASSFIPYYGTFVTPIASQNVEETTRGLPAPVGIARQVKQGIENVITKGNWTKLRQVSLKYGLPFGGTQVSKTVDGIISISKQGQEDSSGKLLFPIVKTKEQMRALLFGPYGTGAGQEYLEKRK